jgi:hypothetical protein
MSNVLPGLMLPKLPEVGNKEAEAHTFHPQRVAAAGDPTINDRHRHPSDCYIDDPDVCEPGPQPASAPAHPSDGADDEATLPACRVDAVSGASALAKKEA